MVFESSSCHASPRSLSSFRLYISSRVRSAIFDAASSNIQARCRKRHQPLYEWDQVGRYSGMSEKSDSGSRFTARACPIARLERPGERSKCRRGRYLMRVHTGVACSNTGAQVLIVLHKPDRPSDTQPSLIHTY